MNEDLAELLDVQGSEVDTLRAIIPPTTYPDLNSWVSAMRAHQADVLKTTIESLRVLKYQPCGGFCAGTWRSASHGLTRALMDADGTPRPAHSVATNALQPLLPVLYPATETIPARSSTTLALHLCNDGVEDRRVNVVAMINDHRGQSTLTWEGVAPADDVVFLDDVSIRGGRIGTEVEVVLVVENPVTGETISRNRYVFLST